jgi:hypothetical protein
MFIGKQLRPRRLRLLDLCPMGRSSIGRALFIRQGKVIHLGSFCLNGWFRVQGPAGDSVQGRSSASDDE